MAGAVRYLRTFYCHNCNANRYAYQVGDAPDDPYYCNQCDEPITGKDEK